MNNFKTCGEAMEFIKKCGAEALQAPSNVFLLAETLKKIKESGCMVYAYPDKACPEIKRLLKKDS